MTDVIVPLEATETTARLWLARFGESRPQGLRLAVGNADAIAVPDAWQAHAIDGTVRMWWQRPAITGLAPGQRHVVRLLDGPAEVATAVTATLPERLPLLDERPFTCLLGSCFGWDGDPFGREVGCRHPPAARAASTRRHVPVRRPGLSRRALPALSPSSARRRGHAPRVLREVPCQLDAARRGRRLRGGAAPGATYFTSDDHELWNNAPNKTPVVLKTWFGPWRQEWYDAAAELYDAFQATARVMGFGSAGSPSSWPTCAWTAPPIVRGCSATPDHQRVIDWIDGLQGPGVLVLGQPMLAAEAGFKGNIADWGLPDYRQYGPLVAAIQRSRHDIVVLTGDVHFGRVAGAPLPSGANLYEVIASPFSLVELAAAAEVGSATRSASPSASCRARWAARYGLATTTRSRWTTSRPWPSRMPAAACSCA